MLEQIRKPLMKALEQARKERDGLEEGIKAIETALNLNGSTPIASVPARTRKPMSEVARKALSARMKKYWAARRKKRAA